MSKIHAMVIALLASGSVAAQQTCQQNGSGCNQGSYTNSPGQDQGQTQVQHATATGNATTTTVATYNPQMAPAVGQGSLLISGCSAGGNAGGSSVHGAAFLGFGWTPHDCYLFYQAQAYLAVGEKKTACEVLNHTHAMQKLVKEGITLPSCEPPPMPQPTVVQVVAPAPVPAAEPPAPAPVVVHKAKPHKAKVCPPPEKHS